MRKGILFTIALILSYFSYCQAFEGKIVYENTYKSKISNVTDEQMTSMMGSTLEYYIKKGDYKTVANGSFFQWQLYVNKQDRLYSKMANSDTLLWNDGAVNSDQILKIEVNRGGMVILGHTCDKIILTCKSGKQEYYFNKSLSVDPMLFIKHKFGNWYDLLLKSNSLPLKSIIETKQCTIISTATNITKMKLENAFFELPSNLKIMKSPH